MSLVIGGVNALNAMKYTTLQPKAESSPDLLSSTNSFSAAHKRGQTRKSAPAMLKVVWFFCMIFAFRALEATAQTATPIPTAGLRAWFRAEDIQQADMSGGVTVRTWRDHSGNNVAVTQTGATAIQPTYVGNAVNGRPALRFDGNDVLQSATAYDLQGLNHDVSIFVVVAPADSQIGSAGIVQLAANSGTGPHGGYTLEQVGTATNKYRLSFQDCSCCHESQGSNAPDCYDDPVGPPAVAQLRSGRAQIFSIINSGMEQTLFVNQSRVTSAWLSARTALSDTFLAIGGAVGGSAFSWKGDVAEIIIYNRGLGDPERQQITDYLDAKYGIVPSLPIPRVGLRAWFRTDNGIVKVNGKVTSWTDYINGFAATQTTVDQQPGLFDDGSGNATVRFDGINDILQTPPIDLQGRALTTETHDLSVFVVMKPASSEPAFACVLDHDLMNSPDHGFAVEQNSVAGNRFCLDWFDLYGGQTAATAKVTVSPGEMRLFTAIKSDRRQDVTVNSGSQDNVASVTGFPPDMASGTNPLAIGGSVRNSAGRFAGDVSAIIIYNRALSAGEQKMVQDYLSDTYALYGTKFTFNLPDSSATSAGVYTTDNRLVRTLWRKITYGPGNITRAWDGKDDNGTAVAPGTYNIKVISHNVQYIWDGLVGNTSTSLIGPSHHAGQVFIQSLAVDGTNAFYGLGEAEGFPPVRRFDTSTPQSIQTATTVVGTDSRINVDHVATDGVRVYYANKGSGFPTSHPSFVAASNVSDNSAAYFTNGIEISTVPGEPVYPSCIDIWPGPHPNSNNPTGLAVQKNGNILAVSHGGQNLIRLFDKMSGAALGTIPVTSPQEMAMTPGGDLWVLSGTTVRRYTNLNSTPQLVPNSTISGLVSPVAITVLPAQAGVEPPPVMELPPEEDKDGGVHITPMPEVTDGETLIVADGGTAQCLKAFNTNGGWTFPLVAGGYATRGPDVTDDKFQFQVGARAAPSFRTALCAAGGTIWVGDGATSRLLRLNATDRTSRPLDQIMFLTSNTGAIADPKTPTRVIGDGFLEFQVDYNRSLQQSGAWTLKKNWAAGLDPKFLANGVTEGMQEVTTLSNGRVYGTVTDHSSSPKKKTVVELPASGPLRICKDAANNDLVLANMPTLAAYGFGIDISQPPSFESDGSQRFIRVANGRVTWYQKDLIPFDAGHPDNPRWGAERILASAPYRNEDPVILDDSSWRQMRHPVTASDVLIAYDWGHLLERPTPSPTASPAAPPGKLPGPPLNPDLWRHLGGVSVGPNNTDWAWKESRTVLSEPVFDGLGSFDIGDNINYAGSLVMVQGRNVVYGFPGENWNSTEASQWMQFYDNGLFVGQFGTPGTFRNRFGSALPGFTGNSFFPTMVGVNGNTAAPTGETYLWADDKSLHSGVARWHLLGANQIREFTGSVPLGGTTILSAPATSFPTGLTAMPGNNQVTLSWLPVSGASSYDVKWSTTNGGPYVKIPSVGGSTYTVQGLSNGTKYYFAVSVAGSPLNSNQVAAFPFDTVGRAGQFAGGQSWPLQVNSGAPAAGRSSLVDLPGVLGDLARKDVGHLGYVIYNWGGGGTVNTPTPVPFTTQSNLLSGISVSVVPGPWLNDLQHIINQFVVDGILGADSAIDLPQNSTGSINITVADSATHHLTVFSPPVFANRRSFTIRINPTGQTSPSASYTINDAANFGDNHVFQFVFTGNITLSIDNGGVDKGACIQALFFD